ncbi:VWA domain-containing protein, partial [Luteitalea sp.]|uniref:VWA domain-containing protein n=1 Tax=Luteitalea sp. TaxID=2004800 RepID=UPI0025C67188
MSLVEVVAVVTGEDDRSLEDLAASDFEVLEDGTARTLVSVRKLSAESRQAAVVGASAGAAEAYVERLPTSTASADAPAFVLLLDDLDTSPRDSHRVIKTGERALSYVPDSALLSVVTTSGIGGSLLTLQPPSPLHIKQVRDFRGQLLLRPRLMSGTAPSSVSAPCGVGSGVLDSLDCADPTRPARRAAAVAAAAEILGRAGSRRKVLLWVTQTMGVSPLDPEGSRREQRRALASALNSDVVVYVLDPRENTGGVELADEKRSGGKLRAGTATTQFAGGAGMTIDLDVDDMVAVPLTQITRETGGRYITMANNLGDLMGRIIEQNSTSYLLVYESPVSRTPGRHRIDVRVKRPGARVSARRGYVVEPPVAGAPASTVDASLLRRTLLGSAPQGQLRLTVQAVPRFATGKSGAVSVTVLAEDMAGRVAGPLDVVLATFDDEGRVSNQHQVRLEPPTAGAPLEFTTELPLSRGRHQLRVAAVTSDASKTGLVITPVEVIEPGRQLLMASPLVLQQVGEQVAPTAVRRFVSGAALGVQAEVAGRPVQDGKVAVKLIVTDASGAVVKTADATLDGAGLSDRRRATGLVDTSGLGPGAYLLTLEAGTGNPDSAVRHAIPVRLDAGPAVPTAGVLRHSVVAHGPASRHPEPGTFVIRDEGTW